MEQLPDMPARAEESAGLAIKKRLGQTRFLTPVPAETGSKPSDPVQARHALSRDLSLLYRLAMNMGLAESIEALCQLVLDALLEAIPAEVGAILLLPENAAHRPEGTPAVGNATGSTVHLHRSTGNKHPHGPELEVVACKHRAGTDKSYVRVSDLISTEALQTREAVLAEDGARNRYLRHRESQGAPGQPGQPGRSGGGAGADAATSLICAPITLADRCLGLIHLYCVNPQRALDGEDLEFAVAVSKQMGQVLYQLQKQQSLSAANRSLRAQLHVECELIGQSPPIQDLVRQIGLVAGTNATCLIRGESGVGKELVARAVHYNSLRKEGPFVCLNCAALTETLLESELFGHEKGAFTGATERKIGKFESAHHGTIFLDEIGEMNVGTQAKLLRILEGHPFERVGGNSAIQVDVRVVAATNQPLEQAVARGTFRRDLFFRLQVVEMRVPSLRERKSDVPLLAEHFLARFVRETGRKIKDFTQAALKKLEEYDWPGNVRELRNVVERAVALGNGPMLDTSDIWLSALEIPGFAVSSAKEEYHPLALKEVEKQHILRTLQHTDWNKSQAASILKIERSTLDRKIRDNNLKR